MPRVERRSRRAGLVGLLVLVVAAAASCTDSPDPEPVPSPPADLALAEIDLTGLRAVRAPFCEVLSATGVTEVLGGEPDRALSHSSGDRARLRSGLVDVVDEHSCTFVRAGVRADAWLFAPPVDGRLARALVRQHRRSPGCSVVADGVRFGRPGIVLDCRTPAARIIRLAGLFGDGWLTCQVRATAPDPGVGERAQRWCAEVATVVAGPGGGD